MVRDRQGTQRDLSSKRRLIGHVGLPWVNTVAADRNGDVLYADASVVPHVTTEKFISDCTAVPAFADARWHAFRMRMGQRSRHARQEFSRLHTVTVCIAHRITLPIQTTPTG